MPTCPWGNRREKRPGNNCWLKGKKGKAEGWGRGGRTEPMMGSGRGHQLGTRELRGGCPSGVKFTSPWGWDRKRLRQAFSGRLGRNSRGSLSAIQEFHLVA